MKKLHLKNQLKPLHLVAKAFINNVMVTWDLIEAGVEISRRPSAKKSCTGLAAAADDMFI